MKMNRARSVEDYQLVASFNELCAQLSTPECAARRERPLSYWALANDRRLPFALLDRSIAEIVGMSFAEIAATPGVGEKKIGTLLRLLGRAARDAGAAPLELSGPVEEAAPGGRSRRRRPNGEANGFHPGDVSESVWTRWKERIFAHGLQDERLGRLAPSLAVLPTMLWDVPLAYYLNMTAAEVQGLKSHGPKRVRAVFETVDRVCRLLVDDATVAGLSARPRPAFIDLPERCLLTVLATSQPPKPVDAAAQVAQPLADQLRADLGDSVGDLVEDRIGLHGEPTPVKEYAERLSVTRARVYQLFDDCAAAMAVRWPEGRGHFAAVRSVLADPVHRGRSRDLLLATAGLAFPERKANAAVLTKRTKREAVAAPCA